MTPSEETVAVNPLVSVVIPTRNRLDLLQQTVASVMTQTLTLCEAIVVDDASSDGTAQWLVDNEDERLRAVILEEHLERSAARNRGLERARGRFVLFLDDDDLFRPLALERLHSALAADSDAIGATGGNSYFHPERGHVTSWSPRRGFKRKIWQEVFALWTMPQQAILCRKDVINAVGRWNEKVIGDTEDWELLLRVSRSGPVVFIPDVVVDIRLYAGRRSLWSKAELFRGEDLWLQEHLDSLPSEKRELGDRLLRARSLWRAGRRAYWTLESWKALSIYLRAMREAPVLLTSPLLRPTTMRDVAKALVGIPIGRRGILAARSGKKTLRAQRERRKQNPGMS